ncbi:hypothetical protein [Actinoplanes sp. NPDC023714]|uniref:hypothetical protein n=1 Tax=Actinoplanes sp. NPDC023714 TaxID=3154322 RepID=UPI0033EE929E
MRRAGRALLVGGVVTVLGAAGTVYAYAGGWTVDGRLGVTAKVAKMPRGAEPSVAAQSRRAVVSWSAQEIVPGVLMDHYTVTAHSVSDPPAPAVTHTVAADGGATESVTFTVAEVAGGTWRWSVTPRYLGWTGEQSRLSRRLTFPAAPATKEKGRETAPAAQVTVTPPRSPATTTAPAPSPAPERTSASPAAEPEPETPPAAPPVESATPPEEPAVPAPAG